MLARVTDSPPRAPPLRYTAPNGTRWQKEKAAAGNDAFELPDDPKRIGSWIIGECVGKGASGRVKIAKHRRTGQLAAVKILPLQPLMNSRASLATQQAKSEKQRLGIDREIIMMKLMNHPNIMRIYDVFEGEKELYLVLEYVEGGELFDFLVNRGRLPPLEALAYFKQIVYGLNYAHTFSIIHRDLKPENILIHSLNPPLIKIADWGMAAFAPPARQLETSCGSPHYASPEIVNGEKYEGNATDIWSCGVILYALLTGRLPFDDKNVRTLLAKVKSGRYEMPHYIDPQARDLLSRMLVVDVARRITIPEILCHPWLEGVTPGIQYVPAPPVSELARPLRSVAHIDKDLLESLRVIWGRHADPEEIKAALLSLPGEGTLAKAFYFLLQKYRDLTLEEHGIVNDVADSLSGKTVTKQYTSPLTKATPQLEVVNIYRGRSSRPVTTPQSRTPSPIPQGQSVSASSEKTTRARPASPIGPRPNRSRPISTPPRAVALRHSRAITQQFLSGTVYNQSGSPSRLRSPASSIQPPSSNYGDADMHPHSRMSSHIQFKSPPIQISSVLFPTVPATPPAIIHAPVPISASAHEPLPMLMAPRTANTDLQRTIDNITERVNTLVARGNAELAHQNNQTDSVHTQELSQERRPLVEAEYVHPYLPANCVLPTADGIAKGENKENKVGEEKKQVHSEHDPMQMSGGLGFGKQNRGAGKAKETGDSHDAAREPMKERKRNRPPTMDFHRKGLSSKRSTLSVLGSPTLMSPPISSILGSPGLGEVKGWFSNLFHWKAQTCVLCSADNVITTRNETTRLLERFGVVVGVEDGGTLRCRADDALDGAIAQKQARFRIEFAPGLGAHANGVVTDTSGCAIMLIQEKGSVATFRTIVRRLQEEWQLDSLQSPAGSGTMGFMEETQAFAVV